MALWQGRRSAWVRQQQVQQLDGITKVKLVPKIQRLLVQQWASALPLRNESLGTGCWCRVGEQAHVRVVSEPPVPRPAGDLRQHTNLLQSRGERVGGGVRRPRQFPDAVDGKNWTIVERLEYLVPGAGRPPQALGHRLSMRFPHEQDAPRSLRRVGAHLGDAR